MNIKTLKDQELLSQTKELVLQERHLLTEIIRHLHEVERRRLFSNLGYTGIFDYAVKELGYSEGQAGRRLTAMRAIKELPELERKLEKGSLSLSNLCQAQSYFREASKTKMALKPVEKLQVLEKLENQSSREGQKILLELQPEPPLPKESARVITENHTEVRFVLTQEMQAQLESVRSLLGPKGAVMSMAELVSAMADLSVEALKIKKFGKKRTQALVRNESSELQDASNRKASERTEKATPLHPAPELERQTLTPATKSLKSGIVSERTTNPRYISKATKYEVWVRDKGQCVCCGSQRNLQYDHVQPFALGGQSTSDNLRLLCFQCNQRAAIKTFGVEAVAAHGR